MQHTEDNREQDTDTETNNHAENSTEPQQRTPAYDLHTYSFDIYKEYAYIKNSNTIELYTILKE